MAEPGTSRQDTEEARAPSLSDREIKQLAWSALRDERLKSDAWNVGLREPDIEEFARQTASVPLTLAGALDQRQRELTGANADKRRTRAIALVASAVAVLGLALLGVDAILGGPVLPLVEPFAGAYTLIVTAAAGIAVWGVIAYRRSERARFAAFAAFAEAGTQIDDYRIDAIRRRMRTEINERADQQYRTTMVDVESAGLAEVENVEQLVDTPARERLAHLLTNMPGGSIGLSGPRGVGKTSLIRAECPSGDDQPEGLLGVIVPAPVEFDAREFILHLFAELCRAVVGRDEVERLRSPDPMLRTAGSRVRRLLMQAGGMALAAAGGALIFVDRGSLDADVIWGALLVGVGLVLYAIPFFQPSEDRSRRVRTRFGLSRPTQRFDDDIVKEAGRRLTDVWFQQSFTSGWSGSISLPIGIEGGAEGSRELARQQMSMPDIVGELRRLVDVLTSESAHERPGGNVEVRIGIDELDKIDSIDDASRFMNEIKVLFGMKRCFFLLSVSQDAMSQFERRGLPLRDVFDSSFDDVVRVEPLSAERSVAMLRERTLGMPVPFMLLCHCMGGGLPRDVIRMAREMLRTQELLLAKRAPGHHLPAVCEALVALQIEAKIDGTVVALRRLDPAPELDDFQSWLERIRRAPTTSAALMRICARPDPAARRLFDREPDKVNGRRPGYEPHELATELLAYLYFCATIQDFFGPARTPDEFRASLEESPPLADELAAAHQAFASHPRAAWDATSGVRKRMEGSVLRFPRQRRLRRVRPRLMDRARVPI